MWCPYIPLQKYSQTRETKTISGSFLVVKERNYCYSMITEQSTKTMIKSFSEIRGLLLTEMLSARCICTLSSKMLITISGLVHQAVPSSSPPMLTSLIPICAVKQKSWTKMEITSSNLMKSGLSNLTTKGKSGWVPAKEPSWFLMIGKKLQRNTILPIPLCLAVA